MPTDDREADPLFRAVLAALKAGLTRDEIVGLGRCDRKA